MNYDFTLDKKGMFSVLASSVLLGALLFVAGLILGSYWTANGPTASAAAKRNAGRAENDLNALPQEPVLGNSIGQSNLVLPNKPATTINSGVGPITLAPGQTQQPGAQPQAASGSQSAAAPDQGADSKAPDAAAADGTGPQTAKRGDASAAPQAGITEAQLVTVEVGTFLDPNAANRLYKTLERKGYAPTFFTGRDAQSREWYSIRIGAYSDNQQAENAAANFTKQEKMKAVVRPLGSL